MDVLEKHKEISIKLPSCGYMSSSFDLLLFFFGFFQESHRSLKNDSEKFRFRDWKIIWRVSLISIEIPTELEKKGKLRERSN